MSANDGTHGNARNDGIGNDEMTRRVVFVGNPNVGKSSMFNALLGARTRTMNAPGTTVSITCGQYHYEKPKTAGNAQNWQFVDTPGTYSLAPMSPDEQVAVNALTGMSGMPVPDLAVVVLDATALSRSLYLLSMVVELGLPTVVALTMNDLAVRNGCGVDAERLSHLLDGMPVVAIDGRTGDGGKALADAIAASFEGTPVPHGLTALPPVRLSTLSTATRRSSLNGLKTGNAMDTSISRLSLKPGFLVFRQQDRNDVVDDERHPDDVDHHFTQQDMRPRQHFPRIREQEHQRQCGHEPLGHPLPFVQCHISRLSPHGCHHTGLPVFVTYSGRGACAFRPDRPPPVVRFRVHLGGRLIRTIQPTTEGADTHF